MEGKAKAEQDSLTQAEEEDTSPLCRPTAQIAAVSACALTGKLGQFALGTIKETRFGRARDLNAKKLRDPTRIGSN